MRHQTPKLITSPQAKGANAICAFVNDELNADTLRILKDQGILFVALRYAGINQVDLETADR
jgi:D-lactate dehydrogenase